MTGPEPIATGTFDVTAEAVVRYAGASGDFTPIHYDPEVLAAAGYSRFFAMGMLTAGQLGGLLCRTFGDDAVHELQVRFRARCWVGSPVEMRVIALEVGEATGAEFAGVAENAGAPESVTTAAVDRSALRRVRLEATQSGVLIVDGEAAVRDAA